MHYIGIDVGKSGAAALLCDDCAIEVLRFIKHTPHEIADWLGSCRAYNPRVYVENVHGGLFHGAGRMGVSSAFSFGKSAGLIEGILCALRMPYTLVVPTKWQQVVPQPARGNKKELRAFAQRLFPQLTITADQSDALLIAYYGYCLEKGWTPQK